MGSFKSTSKFKNAVIFLFLLISLSSIFLVSFFVINPKSSNQSKNNFPEPTNNNPFQNHPEHRSINCTGIHGSANDTVKCRHVKSHSSCSSNGYFNYLEIFYCTCSNLPALGYISLLLWLLVLFYVLGNTTAEYFCSSVESLSKLLKLSPTIAGTTLLPLGNGANDVFSSLISFTRPGAADVGLNSVLGGALFVSCFVVGVVCISISSRRTKVEEWSFIRDVLFFLFTLCCLLMIIVFGSVNLWFALCFVSVYLVYIAVVFAMSVFDSKKERVVNLPVLDDFDSMAKTPLLGGQMDEEKGIIVLQKGSFLNQDPSCAFSNYWNWIVFFMDFSILLPIRLTIPVINGEKWCKPLAASSVTFAPILLATLWNTREGDHNSTISLVIYVSSAMIGLMLGCLALYYTNSSNPPNRFVFPWLAGGFLMSITWTYIIVEELVSLLVAFANILGISPSILGLTVLAWGNSTGDLVTNLSMALKGGADGAQVAVSGCYAGPLFNTLIGLGVSIVVAAWKEYPLEYDVPANNDVYETIGFLVGGLLWALVILPKRKMELDRFLGVGLLSIYLCFLCLRLVKGVGLFKLGDSF